MTALAWPLQDIRFILGVCAHINNSMCKHPLCVGTPPAPFIATRLRNIFFHPTPFVAMYAIQYW